MEKTDNVSYNVSCDKCNVWMADKYVDVYYTEHIVPKERSVQGETCQPPSFLGKFCPVCWQHMSGRSMYTDNLQKGTYVCQDIFDDKSEGS